MTVLDWTALIAYLAVICGIGVAASRKNRNFGEYMFGGGRLPWFAVGVSLIATSVSASTFLGNPADVFSADMTYLMCNIGAFASIIVIGVWFIPRFQKLGVGSAYEILEMRFSRPVRILAAVLYSCHLTLRTGVLLYGPALVLAKMLDVNIYLAICLTSVLAVGYTVIGGLRAVVWTDVLQFFVLMGGGLLTLYFCVRDLGSFGEFVRLAEEAGKTRWFVFEFNPSEARNFLSAGLVYLVFEVAIRGCDQQFVQRYMACRNIREANMSSLLSAGLGLAAGLVFYWVGAALYVYFEVEAVAVLPADTGVNEVFPHFILTVLPAGLTGLLTAAIFAAAMSSLDSAITALANTSVQDFTPGLDEETKFRRARWFVVVWGVIGTIAAFVCVIGQASLLTMALFFTSLFTGPLLGLFLLAFFRPSCDWRAVFGGALIGMASLLPFSQFPLAPDLWEPLYQFSWPWNPLISLVFTLVAAYVFDLLYKVTRNA